MFSVIIPVYNRADLVERTLRSIFAQEFGDYEVIAVNDGSKDNSLEVLRRYEPRIRVLSQENRGLGATRNAAAAHATGRYIVPLDSDDLWLPWTLSTMERAIREANEPALLSAAFTEFAEDGEVGDVPRETPEFRRFSDYLSSNAGGGPIAPSAVAIRRDEYIRVGGFTELRVNCEDADMWIKLCDAPGYVRIDRPVCLALRRGHASMVSNFKHTLEGFAHISERERRGGYPGGAARAWERRAVIAAHLRSLCMAALGAGDLVAAATAYRRSFGWNARLLRLRFLTGFPIMWLVRRIGRLEASNLA